MASYTNSTLFINDDADHAASSDFADHHHDHNTISQLNRDLQSLQIQLTICPTYLLDHRQLLEIQIISVQEELDRLNMGSVLSPAVAVSDDEDYEQSIDDLLGPPNSTSNRKRRSDEQPDLDVDRPRDNKARKIFTPNANSLANSTGSSLSTSKTSVEERWVNISFFELQNNLAKLYVVTLN